MWRMSHNPYDTALYDREFSNRSTLPALFAAFPRCWFAWVSVNASAHRDITCR